MDLLIASTTAVYPKGMDAVSTNKYQGHFSSVARPPLNSGSMEV